MGIDQGLQSLSNASVLEIPRWASNQRHFVVNDEEHLLRLLHWAHDNEYQLCDITVTDNRLLMDRTYRLYYLLSSYAEDELVLLEHGVSNPSSKVFNSIADIFPNAFPFENRIRDLFGLKILKRGEDELSGFILHTAAGYPPDFSPLSRRRTIATLKQDLENRFPGSSQITFLPSALLDGMFVVPVGPIHAGIIEAGHFPFHVAGEVIEEVPVTLGYKHRGVEKLFETHHTLLDGWQLAEKVSGDTAVAHAIAYCQAVEDLAQVDVSPDIHYWRAFLLELERVYNHISDIGLLAIGIAYEKAAARFATLRELFVHYINRQICGHRFLRGLNRPGWINVKPGQILWSEIIPRMRAIVIEALEQGKTLFEFPAARERMINTGVLTLKEAKYATGLVARASGLLNYDFRLRHPSLAYRGAGAQGFLRETILTEDAHPSRHVPVYQHDLQGDVFARLAIRVAELETSLHLLDYWLTFLQNSNPESLQLDIKKSLDIQPEMAFGLGYVEGWRGPVIYLVFKGYQNTIARCDVCDPSFVNWHVLEKAVIRKVLHNQDASAVFENTLADFPLINKSFNLSYAGHDL